MRFFSFTASYSYPFRLCGSSVTNFQRLVAESYTRPPR